MHTLILTDCYAFTFLTLSLFLSLFISLCLTTLLQPTVTFHGMVSCAARLQSVSYSDGQGIFAIAGRDRSTLGEAFKVEFTPNIHFLFFLSVSFPLPLPKTHFHTHARHSYVFAVDVSCGTVL